MDRNRKVTKRPDPRHAGETLMNRAKAHPTPFRLVRAGQDALPYQTQAARHVPLCIPTCDHLYVPLLPGLRTALKGRRVVTRRR
jgi:hypothetical protein